MAISYVASTNQKAGGTGSTTFTLSKPAGAQTDDLLIAAVGIRGRDNEFTFTSTPSGWTTLFQETAGGSNRGGAAIYYRFVQSGDPTSWSGTVSATSAWVTVVAAYRGVDTSNPFVAQATGIVNFNNPVLTKSITNTDANAWRVAAWMSGQSGFEESWSGYSPADTERQDATVQVSGTSGATVALVDSNGAPGTGTWQSQATFSTSPAGDWASLIAALRPAVVAVDYTDSLDDAVSLSDSLVAIAGYNEAPADSEALTDAYSVFQDQGSSGSDTTGISDQVSAGMDMVQPLSDTEPLTDQVSAGLHVVVPAADDESLTDEVTLVFEYALAHVDTERLTDSVLAVLSHPHRLFGGEVPTQEVLTSIRNPLVADSALTTMGVTEVYTVEAPSNAEFPYVLVTFNSPAQHEFVLGNDRLRATYLVTVKVVHDGSPAHAREIKDQITSTLRDAQANAEVSMGSIYLIRRYSGIDYQEHDGSSYYTHAGDVYRVETS